MANLIYVKRETATVWTDTGGDKLLTLNNLGASTGARIGAYLDLGTSPRSDLFECEMIIGGFAAAPQIGESVDLLWSQAISSTLFDGRPTTAPTTSAEGTITQAQAQNCLYAGSCIVLSTTQGDVLQARFLVRLTGRYVAPVVLNRVADNLANSSVHFVTLTPVPFEIQ